MTFDLDTLRNQLLACRQQCMTYDQARIDAEQVARDAVSGQRVAESAVREAVRDAAEHKCPVDRSSEVAALKAEVEQIKTERDTARHRIVRMESEATHRAKQAEQQQQRIDAARTRIETTEATVKALRGQLLRAEEKARQSRTQAAADIKAAFDGAGQSMKQLKAQQAAQVAELGKDIKALQEQAASLRAALKRSGKNETRLQSEIEATDARLVETRKALQQSQVERKQQTANQRLLMRVRQLEAERGSN